MGCDYSIPLSGSIAADISFQSAAACIVWREEMDKLAHILSLFTAVKDTVNVHTIFDMKTSSFLSDLLVKQRKKDFIDSIEDLSMLDY